MTSLQFSVPGIPIPQGSKRLVGGIKTHARLLDANAEKLKPWRATITAAAADAVRLQVRRFQENLDDCPYPIASPVEVVIWFYLPRPKSHYTAKGVIKDSSPQWHKVKPDLDKLVRAVFDSLTDAGVWLDDSQVARLDARKVYSAPPEVEIHVRTIGDDE